MNIRNFKDCMMMFKKYIFVFLFGLLSAFNVLAQSPVPLQIGTMKISAEEVRSPCRIQP